MESVECIINMAENHPDLLKDEQILHKILELVFLNMMDINNDNIEEWSTPADGFNDDLVEDDDQKVIKQSIDFIDRLMIIAGEERMKQIYTDYIGKLVN